MRTPLDKPIPVSFFRNVRNTTPDVREVTLRSLDSLVRARHDANGPDIKMARLDLPMIKLGRFSRKRNSKDLELISGIEGDFDRGDEDLSWILARLYTAGVFAYIHTTSSHTEESPRCRILCPLSRTMKPSQWAALHGRLNSILGGKLDMNAASPSQSYFIGWLEGTLEPEIYHVEPIGGRCLDEIEIAGQMDGPSEASKAGLDTEDEDPFDQLKFGPRSNLEDVKGMLTFIPSDDREIWLKVGMILKEEFAEQGLSVWDEWSSSSARYGGIGRAWQSFGTTRSRKRVGIGTLVMLARQFGFEEEEVDPDIADLNSKHSIVLIRGKVAVTCRLDDGTTSIGPVRDLHQMYANRLVPVGRNRFEPVSKKWERHPRRSTFWNGLTFSPGRDVAGKFNLWNGWAVQPDAEGSCELFLNHLRQVICSGDLTSADYVLGWLAHLVQRPWEKPEVALILSGGKGAGKDTFADYIAEMVGRRHAPSVSQPSHVTGRFNARLESALLLHIQEGFWGGDVQAEQILKYLITSSFIEIERKGLDAFSIASCLRVIMSGNAAWMIPASADERRFAVLEVSSDRCGDAGYFKALRHEMDCGGPAALMHFLKAMDISQFEVRKPPVTDGLVKQKLESLRGIQAWWFDVLSSGEVLSSTEQDAADWAKAPIRVPKKSLRNAYETYIRARRFEGNPVRMERFTKDLKLMLPTLDDVRPRTDGERERAFTCSHI